MLPSLPAALACRNYQLDGAGGKKSEFTFIVIKINPLHETSLKERNSEKPPALANLNYQNFMTVSLL